MIIFLEDSALKVKSIASQQQQSRSTGVHIICHYSQQDAECWISGVASAFYSSPPSSTLLLATGSETLLFTGPYISVSPMSSGFPTILWGRLSLSLYLSLALSVSHSYTVLTTQHHLYLSLYLVEADAGGKLFTLTKIQEKIFEEKNTLFF